MCFLFAVYFQYTAEKINESNCCCLNKIDTSNFIGLSSFLKIEKLFN